ncbi:MAG TPA: hypothetical protein VH583_17250 [Vicinamibacterales bacterium]|jgi:hypothetical protein
MDLSNGALSGFRETLFNDARIDLALSPTTPIAPALAAYDDIADIDQDSAKEDSKEADVVRVG